MIVWRIRGKIIRIRNYGIRKHFFAERVVAPWNSLPPDTADFNSLNKFKRFIRTVDFSKFLCVEV